MTRGNWDVQEQPNNWLAVIATPVGVGAVLLEPPRRPRPVTMVARIRGGATWEEDRANARLIAQSPALRDALRDANDLILRSFTSDLRAQFPEWFAVSERARAVLAKLEETE